MSSLVVKHIAQFLQSISQTQIVTIATVGLVGSSAKGLKALNDKSLLKEFSTNFRSSAGHIKVGYLQSFSQLFGAHRTQPSEPDVEKITEDLFDSIGGKFKSHIIYSLAYLFLLFICHSRFQRTN